MDNRNKINIKQVNNDKWENIKSDYNRVVTVKLGYDENYNIIDNTPSDIYININENNLDKIRGKIEYVIDKYLIGLENIEKLCDGVGYYNKKIFIIDIERILLEIIIIPDKDWISYIGVYINNNEI